MLLALVLQAVPMIEPLPRIKDLGRLSSTLRSAESIRKGEMGIVTMEIDVNEKGRAIGCAVTGSSGFPRLDASSCAAAKAMRFDPKLDAAGNAIASSFHTNLIWGTESKAPTSTIPIVMTVAKMPIGYTQPTEVRVEIDGDGKVSGCRLQKSSGSDAADRAVCKHLSQTLKLEAPKSASDRPPLAIRNLVVGFVASGK